jgi:5'-nucleotidase
VRVLITNDDGIDSPGLVALAEVARARGHDVLVAAPCWDSSGASSSVTGVGTGGEVATEPRSWPDWPEGSVLAVDATPALIALVAVHERFGPRPDVVLSGINRGANSGRAILHSGTVGAAFTAYQHGCMALAMSLDVGASDPADMHWETSAAVAGQLLDWMVDHPRRMVLNGNVPNLPPEELLGVRHARLDLIGTFQTAMTEDSGATVPMTVAEPDATGADTDTGLLQRGFACVTALIPIVEDTTVDFTGLLDHPAAGLVAGTGTQGST